MSGPQEFFTQDHRRCDALWAAVEAATDAADAAKTKTAFRAFAEALDRHFRMEEEVLFPAFEEVTGMAGGPTVVMRIEHTQMRGLLAQMTAAAEAGDVEEVADQGDTLLMLTQQHNVKEEGMLYPMSERALASMWEGLSARLAKY